MFIKKKDKLHLKGVHKITVADVSSPEAKKLHDEIVLLEKSGLRDKMMEKIHELNLRFGTRTMVRENVTLTEGRTTIAKALTGQLSTLAEIEINYVALGTSSAAENEAQTQLQTETFRKLFSSRTYANNIAYVTAFYTATDTDGTFEEHGLFINGTASANSGDIISRLLLGGLVKSAVETLTIETSITINDA